MTYVFFVLGGVILGVLIAVTFKKHFAVDRDNAIHADRMHHDIAE